MRASIESYCIREKERQRGINIDKEGGRDREKAREGGERERETETVCV